MSCSALTAILIVCCPNGLGVPGKVRRADGSPPPPARVTCLLVSPDAAQALSGRSDGRVWLHELETGEERALGQLEGPVVGLAWTSGLALAVDDGGRLARVDLDGGLQPLGRHEAGAQGVAVSPDGSLAATAGNDGEIAVWGLPAGDELGRLKGHAGPVAGLAWGPERLWSVGWDATLRAWKLDPRGRGKAKGKWTGGPRELTAVIVQPAGGKVVTGCWDGEIRGWDVSGRKAQHQALVARPHAEVISALAFDRAGERGVAVASAEKALCVFRLAEPNAEPLILPQTSEPSAAAFVPGHDELLVGFHDGRVLRVDLAAGGAE